MMYYVHIKGMYGDTDKEYRELLSIFILYTLGMSIFFFFVCTEEQLRVIKEWWCTQQQSSEALPILSKEDPKSSQTNEEFV